MKGVKVKRTGLYSSPEYTLEEIPEAALAEMTRARMRPILSVEEATEKNKQFTTIHDFATVFIGLK